MRAVTVLLLASLCTAGCQRESGSKKGEAQAPELAASGGKRVPPGFVTRFTGPDGLEIELAFTQMYAALHQGKMAVKLSAVSVEEPPRSLDIYLDLSNRRPSRVEDLAGAWLTAFPPSVNGAVYKRGGERPIMLRAQTAAVSIDRIGEDAVEGTFSADFGDGEVILDGSFRAARSPNLAPESLGAMAQRSH